MYGERKKSIEAKPGAALQTPLSFIHLLDIGDTALKLVDSVVLKFLENTDIGLFSFYLFLSIINFVLYS